MNNDQTTTTAWELRSRQNKKRLASWTLAWVITTGLAAFGPKFFWDFNTIISVLAIILNLAMGAGMIMAHRKNLQGQDELQQKIAMQAMAITLGVVLIVGIAYELLEDIHLISFQPEISHLIIVMGLTFITVKILTQWNYR